MELSKSYRISTDYKDPTQVNWETLQFTEVVFVDKTHPANPPVIYRLSDPRLSLEQIINISKSGSLSFSRNMFVHVGEALSIDKKKKQILLSNNNTLAYNHLVVASGSKQVLSFKDDELSAALQALTDALRVKPKIPTSFATDIKSSSAFVPQKKESSFAAGDKPKSANDQQDIGKIVHPYIVANEQKNATGLDTTNSRFYEVQI
jgi:hypothetical protein